MAPFTKPARVASASLLRLQSDERLAALARDGHEAAFDALVTRHRAELVRASGRIVGIGRSEDAVQQALLNAHRAIDSTADVTNLRAWLHKITHNSSLNMLRAIRDEVPLESAPAASAAAPGPAEAAELHERLRETLAAIDELPENQRAALLLRELEGRSHEDIAAALDITPGAARQALMRGRQRVRHAVSMLTPYPLLVKLSAGASGPSAAALAELLGGAGASAVALKLGATVAATGAIAGGIVGADLEVAEQSSNQKVATTTTRASIEARSPATAAAPALADADSSGRSESSGTGARPGRSDRRGAADRSSQDDRSARRGRDDHSGRDFRAQNRGRNRGGDTDDALVAPTPISPERDNSGPGSWDSQTQSGSDSSRSDSSGDSDDSGLREWDSGGSGSSGSRHDSGVSEPGDDDSM